jgi:hypothetical protein
MRILLLGIFIMTLTACDHHGHSHDEKPHDHSEKQRESID